MYVLNKKKVKCPECESQMAPAIAINGGESDFWLKCTKCETYLDTYLPMQHQSIMHSDAAKYMMAAGGFGSGKTLFDSKDAQKHMLITPGGRTMFGAPIMPQLRPTLKKDFEDDFPINFVRHVSKAENSMTFINNHELIYRPFDDPHKLRSLNVSRFVILEGSGTKFGTFGQLQTRLRNTAALVYDRDEEGNVIMIQSKGGKWVPKILYDWRKGTIETNPDPGWVRDEFLLKSNRIYLHDKDTHSQHYVPEEPTMDKSTHIIPTSSNYLLPPNFIQENTDGKPKWYIHRYFRGSFEYAEGLVYPEFMATIIKPFKIPKNWKRVIAMDYGINDNTHFIFGAIDPSVNVCYFYDELVISDSNVKTISAEYKKKLKEHVPRGSLLTTPVMDQRSRSQRQSFDVKKTLGDLFEDEGLIFDPAQMDIDSRVLHMNTLIENRQLKIFSTLRGLITEGKSYRFPEKDLDKPGKNTNKPEDKNNHGMNAAEFLCMELPWDLKTMDTEAYNRLGKIVAQRYETPQSKDLRFDPFNNESPQDAYSFTDGLYGGDLDGSNNNNGGNMFDSGLYD